MNTVFKPENDPRAFRTALSRFATGVTIVTINSKEGPIGITANSFASLSLDPPLILWSPAKSSNRHDPFVDAQRFNIHVLSADQRTHAERFTREHAPFEAFSHTLDADGIPVLDGCLSVFSCVQYALHDAGDHTLIIGHVIEAYEKSGPALVFQNGHFFNDA